MKKNILTVLVCVGVLAVAIGILQWRSQDADIRLQQQNAQATNEIANEENNQEEASIEYNAIETSSESTITVQNSMPARTQNGALIIGDENAPVTITEYSSLSCSHCASFHSNTLPNLKKDYIDSGTVKMVFRDFPTNGAAMDASKLLKCVDIDERYEFMNLLFEQQRQWAMPNMDHRQKLMQYAALIGIGNDKAASCMDDEKAEQLIIQSVRAANANYGVSSTPTFVIEPSEEVIVGAQPYGVFSGKIEELTAD